jgi:hypothetical protein
LWHSSWLLFYLCFHLDFDKNFLFDKPNASILIVVTNLESCKT